VLDYCWEACPASLSPSDPAESGTPRSDAVVTKLTRSLGDSKLLFQRSIEVCQMNRTLCLLAFAAAFTFSEAGAQQYVFPAKGQSPEQQKTDEAACYSWAVQQTGYDPAKPPPAAPAAKPPTTATGTTPGAGAKGAVRGAVVGEIVSDDPGAGAAAGAVAGRSASRKQNAAAANSAQQQQAAATQQQQAGFAKARAACLEGKGYTVK